MEREHYPVRTFRMSDDVYKKLVRMKGNETWNLFFKNLKKEDDNVKTIRGWWLFKQQPKRHVEKDNGVSSGRR